MSTRKPHRSQRGLLSGLSLGLALTIVLGVCAGVYLREAGRLERQLTEQEASRVDLLAYFMRNELRPIANDLRALADGDGLRAFFATGASNDLDRAIRHAAFFSRQEPAYDQVRFLNDQGLEIIRINRGGRIVAGSQLQNKADRPYFRQTNSLTRDRVFISEVDLNREQGRVEEPFKPMLRFAMPVFDSAGQRRGVYVINYLFSNVITELQRSTPDLSHRLRLLNASGYWIKADVPDHEWGFMIAGRGDQTLAKSDPSLWSQITKTSEGRARHNGGFFTWHRVAPGDFASIDSTMAAAVSGDRFLVMASEVDASEWSGMLFGLRVTFAVITPFLLGLVVSSAWFFRMRERAVNHLRETAESLSVTLQSIGDAVIATDVAGRVTRMNAVSEHLTGWTQAEALGLPIADVFKIVRDGTSEPANVPVYDVIATGKIRGLANHTNLVHRDGTERAIADSAAPIRDDGGEIIGVVLVFRDVTGERAAEKKLAEALAELSREKARLQRVFDSVPIGISFTFRTADGRRSRLINDTHLRICGLRREQVEEPGIFLTVTHPDDREPTARCNRQLEAGVIDHFSLDKRYLRPDGGVLWVELSYRRKIFADGDHEDLSIVVDITDRKRAEAAIHRQNAQLRSLFETLPGLYLVLTPDLRIITATEAYLAATMTTREGIVGRDLFDVFPDNPADPGANAVSNLKSSFERVKRTKEADTMAIQKYDVRGPDGTFEEKYWSPINSPMLGADQEIEFIIHRVEDVTDFVRQKKAEGAEPDQTLRIRLQQMEAEIFQSSQKIQIANQQLHAANRELESFSYSVSHDLRAPLRHVQGYVEMLSQELPPISEKAQRYLQTIADAGREMGELIDNLLEFSRTGRAEIREADVDLDRLVQEMREQLDLANPRREIEWRLNPLPMVSGDSAMLKQVIANLLSNAVKYTRMRNRAVIEIRCTGEENGYAIIALHDNGAGFDMRYADKLFGVFQRLHRADEFEGTGIGLAIVHRIVIRHGGRVWAKGEPDVGASFYITLKRAGAGKP